MTPASHGRDTTMNRYFFGALLLPLVFSACSRSPKTATIAEWEQYKEPYLQFSVRYPKDWVLGTEGSMISVYSSQDAAKKFLDPSSKAPDGVEVVVSAVKPKPFLTLNAFVDSVRSDLSESGFRVDSAEAVSVDGVAGQQFFYTGSYSEGVTLSAVRLIAVKDSTFYSILYAGFNEMYPAYRSVFDTVSSSLQFPQRAAAPADPSLPSPTFTKLSNAYLEILYPDNFDPSYPVPKGEVSYSLELRGYRQDCTIRIDVFPSKGLTVEKIVEQNAQFYKETSKGGATIDGLRSLFINYSPARNIGSRVYFLVKGDRMYRIILNYFQPLKSEFLPAFEKSATYLHIK
jgi:hypothetical protein